MNKIKTYISKEAEFLGFGEKKFHKFGFTQSQKWSTCEYSIKGYENKIKIGDTFKQILNKSIEYETDNKDRSSAGRFSSKLIE